MSIQTISSQDPFQLERLAEELESRESLNSINRQADLPIFTPLSHENPYLAASTFNVEEFLISRLQTSTLQDLRTELRDYQSALKEELVKLINDDYEAFISLSTDLRGEGARLERLKLPLKSIKEQVSLSKAELQNIQEAIQNTLTTRAELREEQAILHLLLKISESVSRLETLLAISSPDHDTLPNTAMPAIEDRGHENRAKHLSRAASEYTQLLYYVSKARDESCVFVDEIQWRVDRIQSTLSSDLDQLFATTVKSITDEKALSEMDKARLMMDLTECLKTYDSLRLWRDAEDVLRQEIVQTFVKKTIFPGALTAPQSPILPHTPMPPHHKPPSPVRSAYPRTPYTPFTSIHLKIPNFSSSSVSHLQLLDEEDNTLAKLYNQLLRFVDRDLFKVMSIAETVSQKGNRNGVTDKKMDDSKEWEGFEIMANVIWAAFGRAIMDELGSVVFAAGKPDEFRKNHDTTQAFLRSLELLTPSLHSVDAMRSHPIYHAFEKRWQLPVYFQLRWKEIIVPLEERLVNTPKTEIATEKEREPFATTQAHAIWVAITACWSAEVYIPALGHRFWKLNLQLLSRYRTWLLEQSPTPSSTSAANTATSGPQARSSTPVPANDIVDIAADDYRLQYSAAGIADIEAMTTGMRTLWQEEISMMLHVSGADQEPEEDGEGSANELAEAEGALSSALERLKAQISDFASQIVSVLSQRACDALLPVRSIPSQFRAMSNKRSTPPSEPSHFIGAILKPVKAFFKTPIGKRLQEKYARTWTSEIFEDVCQKYIQYLTAMRKTEESLRRLKKGQASTFSLFGRAAAAKEDDERDEERIRVQMILDVNAFGKDAESLGIDIMASEGFTTLREMVHAKLSDAS